MKHKATVNFMLLIWLFCATRLVYAATFAQEMQSLDYQSLLTAVVGGLCGGALKTIFVLASDNRAVFLVLKEARKDLVKSCLAGGAVYVLMIMVESWRPGTITREMRFGGVLIAGWTRDAVFVWAARLARSRLEREDAKLRAGLPPEPPTSTVVPLSDK